MTFENNDEREEYVCNEYVIELRRLRRLIQECAKDLVEIVRMPNVEEVADWHNEAVRKLKAEAKSME